MLPWTMWVCPKCAAIVDDRKRHRKWHRKQERKQGPMGPPGPMGPMGPQGPPTYFSPLRGSQPTSRSIEEGDQGE